MHRTADAAGVGPIIVASAIDEGYLPFALVVANSIANTTSRRRPVEYHVLYCGPPDHWAIPNLEAFSRPGVQVILHQLPNPWAHLGEINRFPAATFFRAAVPDALPDHRRAIYVDVDLVVEDDLGALFDADLAGNPIGATQCVLTVTAALKNGRTWTVGRWGPTAAYFEDELGLVTREQKLNYMQCAVQLFDLEQLRAMRFGDRIGRMAEQLRDRLAFVDQCAVNRMLPGRLTLLDARWNIAPFALAKRHERLVPPELVPVLRQQRATRGILHFGGQKPWRHPIMAGSWRWWRHAFGSGILRYIVAREYPHWKRGLLMAGRRLAESFDSSSDTARRRWAWIRSQLFKAIRHPLRTSRRVVLRLRGLEPDA